MLTKQNLTTLLLLLLLALLLGAGIGYAQTCNQNSIGGQLETLFAEVVVYCVPAVRQGALMALGARKI